MTPPQKRQNSITRYQLTKGRIKGRAEGRTEGLLASIRNLMASMDWSVEQAMEALKVPNGDRPKYAELLQKQ